jgi:hypothetical protein
MATNAVTPATHDAVAYVALPAAHVAVPVMGALLEPITSGLPPDHRSIDSGSGSVNP